MERYCLDHIRRKSESLAQAEAIASNLADTSLRRLSIDRTGVRLSETQDVSVHNTSPEHLAARFRQQERMDLGEAIGLIEAAREVMAKEPNVLRLRAPFVVVGDIHGQFFDLLNLFEVGGAPGSQTSYLFLGDYVDRGSFSCEVMLLLLALKVKFPERCGASIFIYFYISKHFLHDFSRLEYGFSAGTTSAAASRATSASRRSARPSTACLCTTTS
jgi:hypothetical protein